MDLFKRIQDLSAIYDDDGSSATVQERPMFNDGGRLGFKKPGLVSGMRYDNLPDSTQNKIIELSKTTPTAEIARDLQNELPKTNRIADVSKSIKKFLKRKNITPVEQMGGSSIPIEERLAKEKIITNFINKNPEITNADVIAKSINASNPDVFMSPNFVKTSFKRLGLENVLISKHAEIFPQVEKLDKILKKNKALLNSDLKPDAKKNKLLEIYAKETNQSLDEAAANLKSRLAKLGRIYAGEEQRYEKKLYSKIKAPVNYMDSNLHKNIISIADRAGIISNIEMAKLLGLPKKQIDLIAGTANMMNAFDFKVAGDHTDIKALMKNFPDYKKNFTKIEYIKDNLNEYKRSYDRKILSLSKQAKGASPSVQQDLLKKQQVLQNEFLNKTGYRIGGFDIKKGRVTINPQTLRLPDLKNPYNDTLQTAMKNFSRTGLPGKKGTTFNQIDQRLINANSQERIEIFEEIKGTPEAKQSKYLKALQKIPKIGKIATAVIGGTAGAVGVSTLANAADNTEVKSILPEAAAGTAAAATLGTKKGRNIAGRLLGAGFGPTAIAGLTTTGGGYDLTNPLDRFFLSTEAAFAPELVKGTIGATKGMKNRAAQKIAQRVLNLGMSVPTALKVARVAQPLGVMGAIVEGTVKGAKESGKESLRIDQIPDQEQQQMEYDNLITNLRGYAGGGIAKMAGDRSGPPPQSGPTPQGLQGLFNRVKKV